ncbi:MAG: succinate dehydrogenase iron-sulfur subunit [Deferrisomatales bacterium]|nr:succinate dehydrogenase iron-sulfur subunit [Deferrisomatales bacterium]
MERTFRIQRFDPEKDDGPGYREYRVEAAPTDRILDCLNRIRWEQDPSLTLRMSCAHGVCGSDGMLIAGRCALACQRMVREYEEDPICVEPLPNFRVVKDLVVDLEGFFEKYEAVRPYLMPEGETPERERTQSPEDRAVIDEAIRCILCACCTAACPITEENEDYLGPAALLRAFRYLFDSRDAAETDRMGLLDAADGIWGCKGHGKCTEVCPKDIDVKARLMETKKRLRDRGRGP